MELRGDLAGVKRSVATSMARYTPTRVHHSEMSAASAILSTSRMYTTIMPTTNVPIISLPPSLTTTTIEGIRASATLVLCFQGPGLYRGGALGAVGGGLEVPMGPADPSISPRTPMEGVLNATPSRVLSDGNSCDFVFGPRRDRCEVLVVVCAWTALCAYRQALSRSHGSSPTP